MRASEEVLLTALYSISDNNSFLLFNRDPIDPDDPVLEGADILQCSSRMCMLSHCRALTSYVMGASFLCGYKTAPVCSNCLSDPMKPCRQA